MSLVAARACIDLQPVWRAQGLRCFLRAVDLPADMAPKRMLAPTARATARRSEPRGNVSADVTISPEQLALHQAYWAKFASPCASTSAGSDVGAIDSDQMSIDAASQASTFVMRGGHDDAEARSPVAPQGLLALPAPEPELSIAPGDATTCMAADPPVADCGGASLHAQSLDDASGGAGGPAAAAPQLPPKGLAAVQMAPPIAQAPPSCHRCHLPVDVLKAPIVGKGAGSWRCAQCNTRGSQLSRMFGGWPTETFRRLAPSVQESFWQAARDKSTKQELQELWVQTLSEKRIEQEVGQIAGEYLPLSVYKTRGFDADAIVANCNDFEDHAILGRCYRVNIRSQCSRAIEEMTRAEVNEARTMPKKSLRAEPNATAPDAHGGATATPASEGDGSDAADDDDDCDDSSSSDMPRKRGKNGKKDKTSKKGARPSKPRGRGRAHTNPSDPRRSRDDTNARKEADRQAKKLASANIKLATRIIAKIDPPKLALTRDLGDDLISHVPKFAVIPAQEKLKQLERVFEKASRLYMQRGVGHTSDLVVSDTAALCRDAVAAAALLAKFLATTRTAMASM